MGEVFPEAKYQRCTVHFYCNVFSVTPRSKVKLAAKMLKAIHAQESRKAAREKAKAVVEELRSVPFPVSWTVKMKKKQKETQDILSYHSQAAGCSDKTRAKASGGRQPIEECGRTGL